MITKVAVLYQPMVSEARDMAESLARELPALGVNGWIGSAWEEETARQRLNDAEMLITLGGDGTILHAARVARGTGIPMLTVNFGKVGFLAELSPADLLPKLPAILAGQYWLEQRSMLRCAVFRSGEQLAEHHALNEVVVARSCGLRVIKLRIDIDGTDVVKYQADGVIVATATGSTAYALAAGGPIMHPELKDVLLLPICPYMASDRALTLPAQAKIGVTVLGDHDPQVSLDGQISVPLQVGDRIEVAHDDDSAIFVRVRQRDYFYQTLTEMLR